MSEVLHVLRHGLVPSPFTKSSIDSSVERLEAAVDHFNGIVENINTTLKSLKQYNRSREAYISTAQSLTSPIRRLPVELLVGIFSYLVPRDTCLDAMELDAGILHKNGSPGHTIASVCKYWWRILRETTELHPRAIISIFPMTKPHIITLIQKFLDMTAPQPIKILLEFSGDCDELERVSYIQLLRSAVQTLSAVSARWRAVRLQRMYFGHSDVNRPIGDDLNIAQLALPLLKRLKVESCSVPHAFNPERVPALRSLALLSVPRFTDSLANWMPILPQITELELSLEPLQCYEIIRLTSRLESLSLHMCARRDRMGRFVTENALPVSPLTLPHLRRLCCDASPDVVLECLTAPNLVLLESDGHVAVLERLIRRSACMLDTILLHLHTWHDVKPAIGLLHLTPKVTRLMVRDSTTLGDETQVTGLFQALGAQVSGDCQLGGLQVPAFELLPSLCRFDIRVEHHTYDSNFIAFIEARVGAKSDELEEALFNAEDAIRHSKGTGRRSRDWVRLQSEHVVRRAYRAGRPANVVPLTVDVRRAMLKLVQLDALHTLSRCGAIVAVGLSDTDPMEDVWGEF
ncbi:hypothetical protein FISHEDRAFT_71633 [Fistulina hepatica ATCC 64428]|uniref:Uncharacterized protein n=1 Tax=Fistulina hepatica ATCC 64428 TaxID=1128425 RepID=A0A0D7AIC1_9AGAR|nr:hypothetical protein FISHEDRAFT_71633 [Fistulina hepatica ATCC 64428]